MDRFYHVGDERGRETRPGPDTAGSRPQGPEREYFQPWADEYVPSENGHVPSQNGHVARENGHVENGLPPDARRPDPGRDPGRPERAPGRWEGREEPVPPPNLPAAPVAGRMAQGGSSQDAMKDTVALADLLVGMLEYRHPTFRGGSSLVRKVATAIGEEMDLSPLSQQTLGLAAVLRDLGRLSLGGDLLERPRAELTQDDRRQIEDHVELGLGLLDGVNLPVGVREAVRHHHERWDGEGYPDGLKAEEIPLSARILAVADSFVAMIQPRPWRPPMRISVALEELREESGLRYDPTVVGALWTAVQGTGKSRLGPGLREHIVIIHPDEGHGTVLATHLCSQGYLAELAASPSSARMRLERTPLNALIIAGGHGEDTAEFVQQMRSEERFASVPILGVGLESPAERVALLEAGADVCFPEDAGLGEVQHTLAALLQRTGHQKLGAAGDAPRRKGGDPSTPWSVLEGDLRTFSLGWLLQALQYEGRTAAVAVEAADGHHGVVYLEEGVPRHARAAGRKGEDALRVMLGWSSGQFHVDPDVRSEERTIESGLMEILLDEACIEDHANLFGGVSGQ